MFQLIKIQNGRIGVPEPQRITLESAVEVTYGTPVIISGGVLTKLTDTATSLPTHLTLASTDGKDVLVAAITPEMVFETTVNGDASSLTVGTEYLADATGLGIGTTVAASGKRGATVISVASIENAVVTVCFKN